MAKPIINYFKAFDAILEREITFSYIGSQVFANKLYIYDNETNTLVYSEKQTTMQLKHILPSNTLVNGKTYYMKLSVFDVNDTESVLSNSLLFKTLKSPSFSIVNVVDGQTITSSRLDVSLLYSQEQGELLSEYKITLYDASQQVLADSGILYDDNLSHTFTGLLEKHLYYIRGTGVTVNGMSVDTGYVSFNVEYYSPTLESIVNLSNIHEDGVVRIDSGIKVIGFNLNPETPTFINDNMVDLSDKDSYINYNDGFNINDDFTLQLQVMNLTPYKPIIIPSNKLKDITLVYMINTFSGTSQSKAYFILKVQDTISDYMLYSDYFDIPDATDLIHIWIRRINNIYELKVENITKGVVV